MAGDELGYWLPDLLHHAASWGIVTICPALPGFIPVGDGDSTVASARLLSELQPCRSNVASKNVLVDAKKVAVAGYSLGGGRALRGAAGDRAGVVGAVVAIHPWGAPSGYFADKVRISRVPHAASLITALFGVQPESTTHYFPIPIPRTRFERH